MFTIYISKQDDTETFKNVIDVQIKEINYVQLQVTIIHSQTMNNCESLVLDKKDIRYITLFPEGK
jgi:hypothetical protein